MGKVRMSGITSKNVNFGEELFNVLGFYGLTHRTWLPKRN
jgi:hypothetical protein